MVFRRLGPARSIGLAVGMGLIVLGLTILPFGTRAVIAEADATVAVIVGPAGEEITPIYLELAELVALAAEEHGATVRRAYSPDATPEAVIDAVAGANIIVYFGHGTGFPNPYSDTLNPDTVNGWGLQGPNADGTHADSLADGRFRYHGERWLQEHLRPAPGFVMIYSNACYAPGASEGGLPPPSQEEALAHVSNYSRPMLALGAAAYFATDFYAGAERLVRDLLSSPVRSFGDVFRAEPRFGLGSMDAFAHPSSPGREVWLHRSPYFDGKVDYWYAFAGDPSGSLLSASPADPAFAAAPGPDPLLAAGIASSYPFNPGWEGMATVALPVALGGHPAPAAPGSVAVCADRCAVIPVVDSCDCYYGTPDQRVANLSHAAWAAVSDAPLTEGLIAVRVYRDGVVPLGEAPQALRLETVVTVPGGTSSSPLSTTGGPIGP